MRLHRLVNAVHQVAVCLGGPLPTAFLVRLKFRLDVVVADHDVRGAGQGERLSDRFQEEFNVRLVSAIDRPAAPPASDVELHHEVHR